MTAISTTARRILLGVAFTAAGIAGAAAYDAATNTAQAADKPPAAIDCPGGTVDPAVRPTEPAPQPQHAAACDVIGQLIDSLTAPTAGNPHVDTPAPGHPNCAGTATNNSSGGTHLHAEPTVAFPLPILDRLEHARARSTIPTSRHVAIEPGPA